MRRSHALSAAALLLSLAACPTPPAPVAPALPPPAASLPTQEEVLAPIRRADAAYKSGDPQGFLAGYQEAARLSPHNPSLRYRVARGLALTGATEDALATLQALASQGLVYPIEAHPDLASLQGEPTFTALVKQMKASSRGIGALTVRHEDAAPDLILEGLAVGPAGEIYASSVRKRAIYRTDGGALAEWLSPAQVPYGAFGMALDSKRSVLWIATAAVPEAEGLTPAEQGKSALLCASLEGKILARLEPPSDGPHAFGDVALAPDGGAYVSDSASGEIWYAAPGASQLRLALPAGRLRSPQGMALSQDGTQLLVLDYTAGLFALELQSQQLREIALPADTSRYGMDGLLRRGGTLFVTQNGVNPPRVMQLALDAAQYKVQSAKVLARGEEVSDLSLAALAGDALWVISRSQWGNLGPDGALREGTLPGAQIGVIPLSR